MMHILELCLSPNLGGLELYVFRCAEALSKGDRVSAMLTDEGKLGEYFEPLPGVSSHFMQTKFYKLPMIAARRLARLIDKEEVDVIHLHWGKDLPLAALAKYFSRRKPRLVYSRHMKLTRSKRDPYHNFLYGQMDAMHTITEQMAESARQKLRRSDARKVETLYLCVAAPQQALSEEDRCAIRDDWGIPSGATLFGLFGRMEPYKGQHLLIEALARARGEGLNVYGLLVGHEMEAGYCDELRSKADSLGVLEYLVFREFTSDPLPWMQSCDVVVLTTIEETFGLVLPEAMRAGVAVVGSNRGGVLEIISHAETGLLFESGNSNSLYEQIRGLSTDKALLKRLAEAGKRDADERFGEEQHFRKLRELLAGN